MRRRLTTISLLTILAVLFVNALQYMPAKERVTNDYCGLTLEETQQSDAHDYERSAPEAILAEINFHLLKGSLPEKADGNPDLELQKYLMGGQPGLNLSYIIHFNKLNSLHKPKEIYLSPFDTPS